MKHHHLILPDGGGWAGAQTRGPCPQLRRRPADKGFCFCPGLVLAWLCECCLCVFGGRGVLPGGFLPPLPIFHSFCAPAALRVPPLTGGHRFFLCYLTDRRRLSFRCLSVPLRKATVRPGAGQRGGKRRPVAFPSNPAAPTGGGRFFQPAGSGGRGNPFPVVHTGDRCFQPV